jgi:hypothetical protein
MEHQLHKRLDILGNAAEEYLEEIPVELTFDEMAASEFLDIYHLYEECMDNFHTIRSELNYGKRLELIPITY